MPLLCFTIGAVPNCVTGASASLIDFGAGPVTISCPDAPYVSLLSSIFMHGGLIHLVVTCYFCGYLVITLNKNLEN